MYNICIPNWTYICSMISKASGSTCDLLQMTVALSTNASVCAAVGPLNSVPHIGCVGTNLPLLECAFATFTILSLVDPKSKTTCLFTKFKMVGNNDSATLTGVASAIISEDVTASSKDIISSTIPNCKACCWCSMF